MSVYALVIFLLGGGATVTDFPNKSVCENARQTVQAAFPSAASVCVKVR